MPHVITLRPIHEDAIAHLRATEGVTVETVMDVSEASLAAKLPTADALIIRTLRVDSAFLAHCTKLRLSLTHI